MIQNKQVLVARISSKGNLRGNLNNAVVREYPELENLEVTPSGEQQIFKSDKYGYDTVTVKAVESEELNIMPSTEEQSYSGMYNKVIVAGDSNLVPENIPEDKEMFGVKGTAKLRGEENAVMDSSLVPTNTATANTSYILNNMFIKLPEIDTSQWKTMPYLFCNCSNLIEIPELDTSNVTIMTNTFYNCSKLKKIPELNTSNVTSLSSTFGSCSSLKEIPELDTSKVTTINAAFQNCSNLEKIPELDASKITNLGNTFYGCSNLTTFGGLKNIGKAYTQKSNNYGNYIFDLSYCRNLTYESLMKAINNLYDLNLTYDVANGGTLYRQRIRLGSNIEKLQATEEGLQALAEADRKGWDVT